ncbi:aldo/keto reductase [Pseudarthrobacter sp. Fe7]|nr:aldo/keto reductase [Pseudarthrobacter sp. Fe7]
MDAEEQFGVLRELQDEGKVRALGLSQVSVEEPGSGRQALHRVHGPEPLQPDRPQAPRTSCATRRRTASVSSPGRRFPQASLAQPGGPLDEAAKRLGTTTSQVALAWLLRRSPVMMPIPGTGSVQHLEENMAAAGITLDDATYAELEAAGK